MTAGTLAAVRFEFRAYGTRAEIEAALHSAFLGKRSARRLAEIEQAARELFRGAESVTAGNIVYVVVEDDELAYE